MNANEIVMALRDYARAYNAGTPYDFSPAIATQAGNEINHLKAEIFGLADLIESLQAQLAEKIHIKLRTDEDMLTPAEAIETINRLRKAYRKTTAQLAESQRREKAAAELIEQQMIFDASMGREPCDICTNAVETPCMRCSPKWRGIHENGDDAE